MKKNEMGKYLCCRANKQRKAELDVPVALIFFNRPEQFARVFEIVKKAAPSRLFLIQDGARPHNPNDYENIAKCREILKGIDWECDVFTNFSDDNLGCGKRIYTGLTWCFEYVDRLIILEDDCLPSLSFFPFCREVLEKYKDDQRIGLISGMNHLNSFDKVNTDYFFSHSGSIAGWATWKRSWVLSDFNLTYLQDENVCRLLYNYQKYGGCTNNVYDAVMARKAELEKGKKTNSWSVQFGAGQILNSTLIIVPKRNLMSNIGLSKESTNSPSDIKMIPHRLRSLYRLKLYEIDFPLKHPEFVIADIEYDKLVNKMMNPNEIIKMFRKMESIYLRIIHGDGKNLLKTLKRRLKRE